MHLRRSPVLIAISMVLCSCASQVPPPAAPSAAPCSTSDPSLRDLDKLTDEQLARKMLELTGAANLGKQVLDAMTDTFAKTPGLPPGFMARFKANAHPEELIELVVPIYVKNLDRKTMMAAIEYYQSEGGKTLVAHLPEVTKESMEAGRTWGKQLAEKTLSETRGAAGGSGSPR